MQEIQEQILFQKTRASIGFNAWIGFQQKKHLILIFDAKYIRGTLHEFAFLPFFPFLKLFLGVAVIFQCGLP